MSTPESDRMKRKEALKAARKKLALRKKQREELRNQRAARLGGKIDPIISTSSTNINPLMRRTSSLNRRTSLKKQTSLLAFIDFDDDIKEDALLSSAAAPNKSSILRAPRPTSSLTLSRSKNYSFTPINNIETWDKETQTNFDMFSQHLIEEYGEEFADGKASITDEVAANLILSKYKIGWPRELWMHEKSLSPSPQSIMYGDDEEYIQQENKRKLLKKQEKQRKERQLLLIQQRRKERIARKNRQILPENEFDALLNGGDFLQNFQKKSKWMERTLGINNTHFNIDYVQVTAGKNEVVYDVADEDDDKYNEYEQDERNKKENGKAKMPKNKNLLRYISKFATEETEGRAIGDINFCSSNTDWFLASYYRENTESTFYNDGFILVWNLILGKMPEYKLYSESMITSTHFHPVDKFSIYASTTSGQILCYDLRNGSGSKPVRRTALSDGHSSAIFSMDFLQSAGSGHGDRDRKRHLLSISNDGKLCIFKDDALHEKAMHSGLLQVNEATHYYSSTQTNLSKDIAVISGSGSSFSQELSTTCFAYQHKHSDNLIFGSDSGKLYRTDIHNSKGDNDVIAVEQCVDAHFGPITNIDFPKYGNSITRGIKKISSSISGLYLTSSYDWSVKLWHADYLQSIETYTRQNDYVYDVKWCIGGKPGVFVCCDGDRKLNLFDLKCDFKQPINIIHVPTDNDCDAVTKLNWGNNGKYLCCGDSNGNIYLYLTDKSLLYPQQNDFDNFDKAITSTLKTRQLTKQKGK